MCFFSAFHQTSLAGFHCFSPCLGPCTAFLFFLSCFYLSFNISVNCFILIVSALFSSCICWILLEVSKFFLVDAKRLVAANKLTYGQTWVTWSFSCLFMTYEAEDFCFILFYFILIEELPVKFKSLYYLFEIYYYYYYITYYLFVCLVWKIHENVKAV